MVSKSPELVYRCMLREVPGLWQEIDGGEMPFGLSGVGNGERPLSSRDLVII